MKKQESLEELSSRLATVAFVFEHPHAYFCEYAFKVLPEQLSLREKKWVVNRAYGALLDFEELHKIYGVETRGASTPEACWRFRALDDAFLYFLGGRARRGW